MSSDLFAAYLSGDAPDFFAAHYGLKEDRQRAVARALRPLDAEIADAIDQQNSRLAPSAARDRHLALLRRGAAAVVTGQQVGLFLGPLYTLYKAASAVRVAAALTAESGQPVVPIFWLQSEDHDLPEIASCSLPGTGPEPITVRLPVAPANRISIAHCELPGEILECLRTLHEAVGHLPHAEPHLARLERHYRPGVGWTEAFAGLLAEVFADAGLVLVDPRDPALADAARPIHRRALLATAEISDALSERVRELRAAGFAAGIHIRQGAPLSFFHPEGPATARYRLEPTPAGLSEVGGHRVHTREALLAALDADPLHFSTSALLRPILQDSLLPTAAYVGGPAEVAYSAQLAPLYATFDLSMPLLVPRARFQVVDDSAERLISRLRLTPADAEQPEDEILAAADSRLPAAPDLARTLLAPFDAALHAVVASIEPASSGIDVAVTKTRRTVERAVAKLANKMESARLHQNEAMVNDVRRLKQFLYPQDTPQERVYGLPYFAARYGDQAFVGCVLDAVTPFDAAPGVLHP